MAFDIDKYTKNSTGVQWADLDFDEFERNPLPEETLRTLRYMWTSNTTQCATCVIC
jgi:hypothetical protein